ncbi:MAG: hydroxymethylpyrimidine/phosphomethylpyrimidine kinase [Rhodobacteraceae bacterium]|nr:hydroxymethylpyrimidine/phosphomethylpyrimidine kinase [Paracoccaceae bacterium]
MKPLVLLVGGLDSGGGAGVLRDVETAKALKVSSRVAVTAITPQNDRKVGAIHHVPPAVVASQIATATEDPIHAVKLGMLGCRDTVEAVAGALPDAPLIVDPVIESSSGHSLLDEGGLAALLEKLLPKTVLLTPNLPELKQIGASIGLANDATQEQVVGALLDRGCEAVLVKGGHCSDQDRSVDTLCRPNRKSVQFSSRRYPVQLRGSGCRLASAIAAHLGTGADLEPAIRQAKAFMVESFARESEQSRNAIRERSGDLIL